MYLRQMELGPVQNFVCLIGDWTCPALVDTAVKGLWDTLLGFPPVPAGRARGYQGCC